MALDLSKQVGPLPLGMWVAVGAVGLGAGIFMNRNQNNGDEPALEQLVESGVGTGGAQYAYTPPVSAPDSGSGSTITSNAEWGVKAANYIESLGYNGVDSNNAVAKYLVSEPLTALQKLMVNMAITKFGVPPEPLAPVDDTPVVPPGGSDAAPPAITSLRVTQATLRNDIHWSHSGQNVTDFHVLAIRLSTGKQESFWKVGARGTGTSYLQYHFGNPAWRRSTAPVYEYVVRPFNKNTPGPISRVRAPKFRTAA